MFLAAEKQMSSFRAISILVTITLLCLVPFIQKAFHIDDPVYIWVAQHIQSNPFDFYGFTYNWLGDVVPASNHSNPPLISYYIALIAYWFGWSESVLHTAFLVPACVVIAGTYLLAKDLCDRPFIAALAAVCTPAFLISGTTVMCDVAMVSFWVFAVYFWRRGLKADDNVLLAIASVLIALSSLTKYSGMCLIPLLFAYSLFEKRKPGKWMLLFLIPIALLGLYEWTTYALYGKGHITYVSSISMENKTVPLAKTITSVVTGFSFLGGCLLISFFTSLIFGNKFKLITGFLLTTFILVVLAKYDILGSYPLTNFNGINWGLIVQLPFFVFAGVNFMSIVVSDLLRNKDSDALLLFLWITGTFVFAILFNWSVNGRSILPIAPVAGIMIVRQLQQSSRLVVKNMRGLCGSIFLSLLTALAVTRADYDMANAQRTFVSAMHDYINNSPGEVWFEGHWGFQYYMEKAGGKALDYENPSLKKGDIVIIPSNNSNTKSLSNNFAAYINGYKLDGAKLFATMDLNTGAGFYSDVFGPLPFALGATSPEKYYLYKMTVDKQSRFSY